MVIAPLVSVVMSVYNGEKYISEAIESILNQTFSDFEFIIINDGSTDGTSAILHRCEQVDSRLRVYHQEHCGLIASLNRGCRLAQGNYIARMDADDVSMPERLTRQVHYMKAHPGIGVLGTWIEYIDENGTQRANWRMPTVPALIGWSLFFGTCLAHPSVLMRRDVIERLDFYCPEALYAEDYDLWTRVSIVSRIANVPDILLQRRVWQDSVCSRHFQAQEQNVVRIMRSKILQLLESEVCDKTVSNLRQLATGSAISDFHQIQPVASLVRQLYQAYLKANSLNRKEVGEVARDAGRKLFTLAVWASRTSLLKGSLILAQALKLYTSGLLRRLSQKA
jgi:glycosyltransferase involved in cell wall biosynthesis